MEERSDIKTIMCSVLFLDIVEYSRKSVAGQISLKERFNSYLFTALRDVPMTDRIILDTSDGAVINFLGDIDDALKVTLGLRENLLGEDPDLEPPLLVRMGINLGPVRLVRDVNGHPNIVGDGINVAQRIMGFADINQILVSRSYRDAVLRLAPQYGEMLHYQGSRTDKHVREHEVYALGHPGDEEIQQSSDNNIAEQAADHYAEALGGGKLAGDLAESKRNEHRAHATYIGAAAIFMALVGALAFKLTRHDKMPALPNVVPVLAASGIEQASAVFPVIPASSPAEDKVIGASMAQPATTLALEPDTAKVVESKSDSKKINSQAKHPDFQPKAQPKTQPQLQPQTKAQTQTQHHTQAPEANSKNSPVVAAGSNAEKNTEAYISISCDDGTRVFVDGMQKGKVSAGVLTLALSPAKHLVIVNHPNGNIYSQNVDLEPGKTLRIRPNICK